MQTSSWNYKNRGSTVFHSVSLLVFYMRISNEEIIMVGRLLPCLIIFQIRLVVVVYPGCCKGNQFTFGKCIHIVYSRKNSSVVVFMLIFSIGKHPFFWNHFDDFLQFLKSVLDWCQMNELLQKTQNVETLMPTSDPITLESKTVCCQNESSGPSTILESAKLGWTADGSTKVGVLDEKVLTFDQTWLAQEQITIFLFL